MSKCGKDCSSGRFYCVNVKRKKVDFQEWLDVADIVSFRHTFVLGMEPIESDKTRDLSSIDGRWFLGIVMIPIISKKDKQPFL